MGHGRGSKAGFLFPSFDRGKTRFIYLLLKHVSICRFFPGVYPRVAIWSPLLCPSESRYGFPRWYWPFPHVWWTYAGAFLPYSLYGRRRREGGERPVLLSATVRARASHARNTLVGNRRIFLLKFGIQEPKDSLGY